MSWGDRIRQLAEDRLGVEVVDRDAMSQLRESQVRLDQFMEEASELAYHTLDYFSGKPQDMRPERRARLAQRSRVALMEDPLAGAEADLLSNFAFGRGVGVPQATDPRVQAVIEEAWNDPVNQQKLTSFEAQRHRSNELLTQANLYPAAFMGGGRVRLAFVDADTVVAVVTDPDDEERPLYYVSRKRHVEWDFDSHRVKTTDEMRGELPKLVYYQHWRNVEDYKDEVGEEAEGPQKDDLAEGVVEHIRINRIGRTQFGTPPWARTLRFYSALNQLTTAHVQMAQAASTIVAKRSISGSPNEVTRQANNILAQTGEIAAARFGMGTPPQDVRAQLPPEAGSFWIENQAQKLEPVALQSGAAQMVATTQIVRAPIAAASGFGQHYLGDASSANLATATSLELPTLMTVQAWQETFEQLFRWFIDLVIQTAVRSGRLSGQTPMPDEEDPEGDGGALEAKILEEAADLRTARSRSKSLDELCYEDDQAEMERRTGLDLSYTFEMPYPGRRNLPDVVALVTSVAGGYDPNGQNVPLRRALLLQLATHGLQVADPQAWVDDVLPEDAALPLPDEVEDPDAPPEAPGRDKDPLSPEAKADPSKGDTVKRARTGKPQKPKGEMSEEDRELLRELRSLEEQVEGMFTEDVLEPLLAVR